VAGGDVIVGVGTLLLALFTWRLARQTRALSRSTATEVRSGSRPVLVDEAA